MSTSSYATDASPPFAYLMDYVEGKLPAAEAEALEARLAQDADLEAYVDELHDAWLRNPDLRAEVLATHASLRPTLYQAAGLGATPRWTWLVAALSVALLLSLGWWLWPSSPSLCDLDTPQAVAREVGLYQQQFLMMSARNAQAANLEAAFATYDQGDYDRAISQIRALLDTSHTTLAARELTLCLGVSYFMSGQYAAARPHLQRARRFTEPRYGQEAAWYLALSAHAQGRDAEARRWLDPLAAAPGYYQTAAQTLRDCW